MKATISFLVVMCTLYGMLAYEFHKGSLKTPEQRHQEYVQIRINALQKARLGSIVELKNGTVEIIVSATNGVVILIAPNGVSATNDITSVATNMAYLVEKGDIGEYGYRAGRFINQVVSNSFVRVNSPTK